jgi:hypothetical protein
MYSLRHGARKRTGGGLIEMPPVPVVPVRAGLPAVCRARIGWPPGWAGLWTRRHEMPMRKPNFTGEPELR